MRWNRYNYNIIYIELLGELIAKESKETREESRILISLSSISRCWY